MTARTEQGTALRWVMAIALAYALLFQGLAGAMAATLHATPVAQGAAPDWCMPSGDAAPGPAGDAHPLLCCMLGCTSAQQPMPLGASGPGDALAPPALRGVAVRFTPAGPQHFPTTERAGFEATGPPGSL